MSLDSTQRECNLLSSQEVRKKNRSPTLLEMRQQLQLNPHVKRRTRRRGSFDGLISALEDSVKQSVTEVERELSLLRSENSRLHSSVKAMQQQLITASSSSSFSSPLVSLEDDEEVSTHSARKRGGKDDTAQPLVIKEPKEASVSLPNHLNGGTLLALSKQKDDIDDGSVLNIRENPLHYVRIVSNDHDDDDDDDDDDYVPEDERLLQQKILSQDSEIQSLREVVASKEKELLAVLGKFHRSVAEVDALDQHVAHLTLKMDESLSARIQQIDLVNKAAPRRHSMFSF